MAHCLIPSLRKPTSDIFWRRPLRGRLQKISESLSAFHVAPQFLRHSSHSPQFVLPDERQEKRYQSPGEADDMCVAGAIAPHVLQVKTMLTAKARSRIDPLEAGAGLDQRHIGFNFCFRFAGGASQGEANRGTFAEGLGWGQIVEIGVPPHPLLFANQGLPDDAAGGLYFDVGVEAGHRNRV